MGKAIAHRFGIVAAMFVMSVVVLSMFQGQAMAGPLPEAAGDYLPTKGGRVADVLEAAGMSGLNAGDAVVLNENGNIAEGDCGTCHWVIDADGCLTIGAGELESWNSTPPWYYYRLSIRSAKMGGTVKAKTCDCMFYGCSSLASLDLTGLDTSSVTDMGYMVRECSSLASLDLTGLDTSSVTYMGSMFCGCSSLASLDLTGLDTSSVTYMGSMFSGCSSLASLDLSGLGTSSVTYMGSMFSGCSSLASLDLTGLDTSSVTYMGYMFYGCSKLGAETRKTCIKQLLAGNNGKCANWCRGLFAGCPDTQIDLTGLDTSSVTGMGYMFYDCKSLSSLDLSGLDTSKVADMGSMFGGCSSLETIYVGGGWTTDGVTSSSDMFFACTNLVGGAGTAYDPSHTNATYARIDGGPNSDTPGYLTYKGSPSYKEFKIGHDNNSFGNIDSDFAMGYRIPNDAVREKLINLFNMDWSPMSATERVNNQQWKNFEGSCFGIAATEGLVFDGELDLGSITSKSDISCYHELGAPSTWWIWGTECDEMLQSVISYYQLAQKFAYLYSSRTMQDSLRELVEGINKGGSNLIRFNYVDRDSERTDNNLRGHAVLAPAQQVEDREGFYVIKYYDENWVDRKSELSELRISKDYGWVTFCPMNRYFHWSKEEGQPEGYDYLALIGYTPISEISELSNFDVSLSGVSESALNDSVESAQEKNTVQLIFPVTCDFEIVNSTGKILSHTPNGIEGDWETENTSLTCEEIPEYTVSLTAEGPYKITFDSEVCDLSIYDPAGNVTISGTGIEEATFNPGVGVELGGASYDYSVMSSVGAAVARNGEGVVTIAAHASGSVTVSVNDETLSASSASDMTNISVTSYLGADRLRRVEGGSGTSATGNAYFNRAKLAGGDAYGWMESLCADAGSSITLPEPAGFSIEGKEFKGWELGGMTYQPGDTYELKGDVTFTAQWGDPSNDISEATVEPIPAQHVTGGAIKPAVVVTLGGSRLVEGSDYTVDYSSNVAPGTAHVVLTGAGSYRGTKETSFTITDHEWGAWGTSREPTCTVPGEWSRACAVCGKSESEEIAALGHDWGEWEVTKVATALREGAEARTCSRCGEAETRAVPKLDPVEKSFPDVQDKSAWYYDSVYRAAGAGLIDGYDDGNFGPLNTLTRAQAATILWRYYEPEAANAYDSVRSATENGTGMGDVKSYEWYTGACNWAVSAGVISGKDQADGSKLFDPDGTITREQLCAIVANASHEFAGSVVEGADRGKFSSMPDNGTTDGWAVDSVAWGLNHGVISGKSDTYIAPLDPVTRAEMAAILMNSIDNSLLGD